MAVDDETPATVKKATILTSGDKIMQHDLIKLVSMIGKDEIIQIAPVGNEIRLNLRNSYELNSLDNLKNSLISPNLRISGVRYAGKRQEILVTIVGLDSDVNDEDVREYVETFIEPASSMVIKQFHKEHELRHFLNGKRTMVAHKILNRELVGSYHQIAGQSVRIFFHGVRSCGYCFLTESTCALEGDFNACKRAHKNIRPIKEEQINVMRNIWASSINTETNPSSKESADSAHSRNTTLSVEHIQHDQLLDSSLSDDINEANITPQDIKNSMCKVMLEQMTSPVTNEEDDTNGIHNFKGTEDLQGKRSYAEAVSPTNKRKSNFKTGDTPPEKFSGKRIDLQNN